MSLIFTKTQCRCWIYIYFWQSFLALKKRKMMEIWKNKNAKNFRIFLFTLPDLDDLIKHTFAYWHTRPHSRPHALAGTPSNEDITLPRSSLRRLRPVFPQIVFDVRRVCGCAQNPVDLQRNWNHPDVGLSLLLQMLYGAGKKLLQRGKCRRAYLKFCCWFSYCRRRNQGMTVRCPSPPSPRRNSFNMREYYCTHGWIISTHFDCEKEFKTVLHSVLL